MRRTGGARARGDGTDARNRCEPPTRRVFTMPGQDQRLEPIDLRIYALKLIRNPEQRPPRPLGQRLVIWPQRLQCALNANGALPRNNSELTEVAAQGIDQHRPLGTSRSRVPCNIHAARRFRAFTAKQRIVGRITAAAMDPASAASDGPRFAHAFTRAGGISFPSWPNACSSPSRLCAHAHAAIPIRRGSFPSGNASAGDWRSCRRTRSSSSTSKPPNLKEAPGQIQADALRPFHPRTACTIHKLGPVIRIERSPPHPAGSGDARRPRSDAFRNGWVGFIGRSGA